MVLDPACSDLSEVLSGDSSLIVNAVGRMSDGGVAVDGSVDAAVASLDAALVSVVVVGVIVLPETGEDEAGRATHDVPVSTLSVDVVSMPP